MDKKNILIVDDDEALLNSFKDILELEGYIVDTAVTGKEAIEKSKIKFYNLALLDIRLPDMDGIDLLTKIKETTPKMVKIMVTGYPTLENAISAVNKGADGYVTKPVNIDDLLNSVKDNLRKQNNAQQYTKEKVKDFIETRVKEIEEDKKQKGNS